MFIFYHISWRMSRGFLRNFSSFNRHAPQGVRGSYSLAVVSSPLFYIVAPSYIARVSYGCQSVAGLPFGGWTLAMTDGFERFSFLVPPLERLYYIIPWEVCQEVFWIFFQDSLSWGSFPCPPDSIIITQIGENVNYFFEKILYTIKLDRTNSRAGAEIRRT